MSNELIGLIDGILSGMEEKGQNTNTPICNLLRDCKAALQPSLPQDVEEWIEANQRIPDGSLNPCFRSKMVVVSNLRAFLADKVLVPVEELRPKIIDCLLSTSGLSEGATADAIVYMLTASKWE